MQNVRDLITPEALALIRSVATQGSMAAAAREMGLVPSAVTYRVRQIEDALDVLLFDRSARQARITPAGQELLRGGERTAEAQVVARGDQRHEGPPHAPGRTEHRYIQHRWVTPRDW